MQIFFIFHYLMTMSLDVLHMVCIYLNLFALPEHLTSQVHESHFKNFSIGLYVVITPFNWIDISLLIGCLFETQNYSILSVAFITSSSDVTEENLVFETVHSGP